MIARTRKPSRKRQGEGYWLRLMASGPNWIGYRDKPAQSGMPAYHQLHCDRCGGHASYLAENAAEADREFVRAHCSCARKEAHQ